MILGIRHFLEAVHFLLAHSDRRSWLFRQFRRALFVGITLLVLSFALLAVAFFFLFEAFDLQSFYSWLGGIGFALMWMLLLFFGAAPLAVLGAGIYLSERPEWKALQIATNEVFLVGSSKKHSIFKSLGLLLLVVACSPFLFIPFLAWINLLVTAYALSQEWIWSGEELLGARLQQHKLSYKIGLGLIPAAAATIPILGLVSLPFLQAAVLLNYRSERSAS